MSETTIAPLLYSLEDKCPVPWTEAAEGQLHRDYPFLKQDESTQEFVIRRYLETLWLPESFSPLSHFVPSLRRINLTGVSSSSQVHQMHSLLEPLLLSTRAASDKYRTELVQILANGGGAEEQEEMMMWYAWGLEKADSSDGAGVGEEKWRRAWLERLERREAMIQTLLLLLKLSLPGPRPPDPKERRKTNKGKRKSEPPVETTEERLEGYMDKLAVWQLTAAIGTMTPSSQALCRSEIGVRTAKHWTQSFYEDIVEPLFKSDLPEQCELFRSKLFPEPPISDSDQSDVESLTLGQASRSGSRAPSVSRGLHTRAPSTSLPSRTEVQRSRSCSLSVSLAQDEASQRANVVGPRHALSREVSMSRVFKEKPKTRTKSKATVEERKTEAEKPKTKRDAGTTLVQETPMKHHHAASEAQSGWYNWCGTDAYSAAPSPPPTSSSNPGDVCIEDTPLASRTRRTKHQTGDSLSPLYTLSDDSSNPSMMKAVEKREQQRSIPTSNVSHPSRLSHTLQHDLAKGFGVSVDDEHADESYIGAFKLSRVILLDGDRGDQDHAMLASPSPPMRNSKPSIVDKDIDVEMATPKKRARRRK